jgi:hypothetical protein
MMRMYNNRRVLQYGGRDQLGDGFGAESEVRSVKVVCDGNEAATEGTVGAVDSGATNGINEGGRSEAVADEADGLDEGGAGAGIDNDGRCRCNGSSIASDSMSEVDRAAP